MLTGVMIMCKRKDVADVVRRLVSGYGFMHDETYPPATIIPATITENDDVVIRGEIDAKHFSKKLSEWNTEGVIAIYPDGSITRL